MRVPKTTKILVTREQELFANTALYDLALNVQMSSFSGEMSRYTGLAAYATQYAFQMKEFILNWEPLIESMSISKANSEKCNCQKLLRGHTLSTSL